MENQAKFPESRKIRTDLLQFVTFRGADPVAAKDYARGWNLR